MIDLNSPELFRSVAHIGCQTLTELTHSTNDIISYVGIYGSKNWGDALNGYLINILSGKIPCISGIGANYNRCVVKTPIPTYSVIGSILQPASLKKDIVVYGTGFMNFDDKIINSPKEICAVRGKLTAEKIDDCIGQTTNVFGDPAVLFKDLYQPMKSIKYHLGIIPHWSDYYRLEYHFLNDFGVRVINPFWNREKFINELCKCERIASSSLHGLIMADVYGKPTVWMKILSDESKDNFKFYDYYSSIRCEREPINPLKYRIEDMYDKAEKISHQIDREKLLSACPFRK